MRKIIVLLTLLLFTTNANSQKIVYLDVQFIIDNSDLGKFYKTKIKKMQNFNSSKLKDDETKINNMETEIKNLKNIISETEKKNKVNKLNLLLKDYQIKRVKLDKEIIDSKKNFTAKILEILNPILTNFVEKENIVLVVEKKNILVGIKSLDITKEILEILNQETINNNLINEN